MNRIILCGLGAVGLTFAVKFAQKCNRFSVLVDEERLERYKNNPPIFNGIPQELDYILPFQKFDADLIIIATKASGLDSAIENIKNFVSEKTRIISLINGISSEEKISQVYPQARVLKTYFIGHSAVRDGNNVTQDGVGEIVTEKDEVLQKIFELSGIRYSVAEDINYSLWLKYVFNIFSNQTSAILGMTFGEMKKNKEFIAFAKKIVNEIKPIAKAYGVNNTEKLEADALNSLNKMCDEGKTSMLQDILSFRKTEVEIFSGEIIKLGEKYAIPTPYNKVLYDLIKIKEEQNEHSIHTGQGRK